MQIAYFQNSQLMASVAEMMGSRFGQISMPAFGQGAATRGGEGVSTGEGAGAARSDGGAVNVGLFTDGAGAAGVASCSGLASCVEAGCLVLFCVGLLAGDLVGLAALGVTLGAILAEGREP